MPLRLPKPFADLRRGGQRLRFFHGDALDILGPVPDLDADAVSRCIVREGVEFFLRLWSHHGHGAVTSGDALDQAGRDPQTEICRWRPGTEARIPPVLAGGYEPSKQKPPKHYWHELDFRR